MNRANWILAGIVFLATAGVSTVQAVVNTIGATVSANVEQAAGGSALNSDSGFDQLDLTTFNFPLDVEARLTSDTISAAATTHFSDPRLIVDDKANEFALDAVGFNQTTDSALTGASAATETREVVFSADEVGLSTGTAVEAQSFFFVDGIMILLGKANQLDYAGAKAETTIKVIQERDGADPVTVLEATITLVGNADGTATLIVDGSLTADNLTTFGLIPAVQGVPGFQAVFLPDLAIPYVYQANVDETFHLRAEIKTHYDAPAGTGSIVVLGKGLADLIAVMTDALGPELTALFSGNLTSDLGNLSLPSDPLVTTQRGTTLRVLNEGPNPASLLALPCGSMGAELALMAVGFCGLIAFRFRR